MPHEPAKMTRYSYGDEDEGMMEYANGDWVRFSDAQSLAAENERLTKELMLRTEDAMSANARATADAKRCLTLNQENERLREALRVAVEELRDKRDCCMNEGIGDESLAAATDANATLSAMLREVGQS